MANQILELKQKRTAAIGKASEILKRAAADSNRALTVEEQTEWDGHVNEATRYKETLDREERMAAMDTAIQETRGRAQEDTGIGAEEQAEIFRSWIRHGIDGVEPDRRSLLIRGSGTAYDFHAPQLRAAQSELTNNLGGYVVPQGFFAEVQEALKFYEGVMEAGPTVINTSMGNDLPIPTSDDTNNEGQILAESSPETTLAIPFDQVTMKAYKYSSRLILVPLELLQDSGVDIQAFIVKRLAERLGRILNRHFTLGTGVSQPRGVTLDATQGKVGANGQTASIIYDDLIDLKYSVNRSYRTNAKWMMADSVLTAILKLHDSNNRPLILDYLQTLQAGEPEKILGQQIVINGHMPDMGVSVKSILYGDFSTYWVRRVMSMLLMRLVERFAEAGQVGFLAFMRADGRMVDAGTHPIKYYQNAAS
jgi:HK97 family phage major capsid protein